MSSTIELHAILSGVVQGVGLRATILSIATELNLTGHVTNTPNGKVEIVAQGPKENLESLLKHLKKFNLPIQIDSIKKEFYEPELNHSKFTIK